MRDQKNEKNQDTIGGNMNSSVSGSSKKINVVKNYTKFYFYLRGHIRNSLHSPKLYDFVNVIKFAFPNVKFVYQTWRRLNCKKDESWKPTEETDEIIDTLDLKDYFQDPRVYENGIIINEKTIIYYGRTEGKISKSLCPIKGWKNMWYGKHQGLANVKKLNGYTHVFSFRFDYFDVGFSKIVSFQQLLTFIKNGLESQKVQYLFKDNQLGVDNAYIGPVDDVKKLCKIFFENLDEILVEFPNLKHQEFLVPNISNFIKRGELYNILKAYKLKNSIEKKRNARKKLSTREYRKMKRMPSARRFRDLSIS